jgi:hypothetical protein
MAKEEDAPIGSVVAYAPVPLSIAIQSPMVVVEVGAQLTATRYGVPDSVIGTFQASADPTTLVAAEVAGVEPEPLEAVTITRMVSPLSESWMV